MKHIDAYTREEIISCLNAAGYIVFEGDSTEDLRNTLSSFIADGLAPELEQIDDYLN